MAKQSTDIVKHDGSGMRCLQVSCGNYMANAIGPAEAAFKMKLDWHTWGHLAPKSGKKYQGFVVFTHTAWGDLLPINAEFKGLDSSPQFFDDLVEFVSNQCTEERCCQVWRFDGFYIKNKNGTCGFQGSLRQISVD